MADRALSTPVPLAAPAEEAELDTYVRRNVILGLTALVVLIGVVGVAGVLYEVELHAIAQAVYDAVGVAGLAAILFVSDSVITPIPPDILVVIIAKSDLRDVAPLILAAMGVLSSIAGNTAWLLGSKLGDVGVLARIFDRVRKRNERLVARYGAVGVALGALTPIPFSVTCWTAGLLRMRFRSVFWPTLLRIPRFFVYYALIAYSDQIFRPFF